MDVDLSIHDWANLLEVFNALLSLLRSLECCNFATLVSAGSPLVVYVWLDLYRDFKTGNVMVSPLLCYTYVTFNKR